MYEIWTYGVTAAPDKVYYAVWGGGVLEYDVKTERWKDYNDPDGENEIVLFKDQGLIHEITTSVSYVNKILWVATYFGVEPLRRPQLAQLSGQGQRPAQQFPEPGENRRWHAHLVFHRQRTGVLRRRNWATYRPALDTHAPEMLVRDAPGAACERAGGYGAGAQLHIRSRFSG